VVDIFTTVYVTYAWWGDMWCIGVLLTYVRLYSSYQFLLALIAALPMLNHICHICCKPGLNLTLAHCLSFHGNCLALSHKLHFSGITSVILIKLSRSPVLAYI